ncbi:hypothetical protein [Bradyrhizobium sp. 2S1]|uniref:hypothetical protein n=1 Tax=Bradyrhizobium sp. 2S1 TaxID=1404429 RepID=UPI00140E2155|nr:hypothetical protein [Bradyrhizobium sp. 2S1]MCK7672400.1 hypothetical protein [Bradyrhizobium sp. 2S1]
MRRVGIVSLDVDLHAHAVAKCLRERFNCSAHVFCVDQAHRETVVTWAQGQGLITDYNGETLDLSSIDVLWWRRANQPQSPSDLLQEEAVHAFVSAEWRFALSGLWAACFRGVWVNDPRAEMWATGKQVQLDAAAKVGFRVPKTIISNDPDQVRNFSRSLGGRIIIKKIAGAPGMQLATVPIDISQYDDDSIRLAPSVYQELISAKAHYRVVALGDKPIFIEIISSELDWRRGISARPKVVRVDDALIDRTKRLIRNLGLKMGIADFVIDQNGDVVFLEVNVQGQFLFLDGIGDIDTTTACAEFLASVSEPIQ